MPRNKFGGNKAKKSKNFTLERDFILKEKGQEYAKINKILGNGRFELNCNDGTQRLGHLRGKMKKRQWINKDDTVLVGLRDYQDNKADIIHKYTPEEVNKLTSLKEIVNEQVKDDECVFTFDEI